jgi:hypothetical protein
VIARPQRRRFSAEYKLSIIEQADSAQGAGGVGALLRREGLYSSHLATWRQHDRALFESFRRSVRWFLDISSAIRLFGRGPDCLQFLEG